MLGVLMALAAALALSGPAAPSPAQGARPAPAMARLFPQPTGANGCEELAEAGDLLAASVPLNRAVEPGATLAQLRAALADPPVARGLALLRRGLAKPFALPPRLLADDALFDFTSLVRWIGRALLVEQYVLLADGRAADAIESLRTTLALAERCERGLWLGGLVGIAVTARALNQFAAHVAELSVDDCRRVEELVRAEMAAPEPLGASLALERDLALKRLADGGPAGGMDLLPYWPEIEALFHRAYDDLIALARRPAWKRGPIATPPGRGLAHQTFRILWEISRPAYERMLEKWTEGRAMLQLLGIHAAIRRYRWERRALPAGPGAPGLAVWPADPFTGGSPGYRVTGPETYELWCAGPPVRDAGGRPTGARARVWLPSRPAVRQRPPSPPVGRAGGERRRGTRG